MEQKWDTVIKPKSSWFKTNLREVWNYRDLMMLFVKRDVVANYKQTILGPIWFFIEPIFTSTIFTIFFAEIADVSTDGVPPFLFYLAGLTMWNYFADCFTKTSNTFIVNAGIFGKVYFPRLILPLSTVISNFFKFVIQFMLFAIVLAYFVWDGWAISIQWQLIWVFPLIIIIMGMIGFGFGVIISSLTTKYRDMQFLVGFGTRMLMYMSSVVLPVSIFGKYENIMMYNPLVSIIEALKFIFTGKGHFDPMFLLYAGGVGLFVLLFAVVIFNRVEKTFVDTV